MTFDGIISKCIINELNNKILNGKIERITMPNKNEIYMYVYNNTNKCKYIICINCNANEARINLTQNIKTLNPIPPMFCMVIRKHLQNAKITNISQYMSDRVIDIEFEGYNELNDLETKHLFIELMGKHSNTILVNNNFKIIDSMRHVDDNISSVRIVLPGIIYEYPKTKNDFTQTSINDFKEMILKCNNDSDTNISPFLLYNFNGFSNLFIQNVLLHLNINMETHISNLGDADINNIYSFISNVYSNIQDGIYNIKDENTKHMYIDLNNFTKNNISISKYIDEYYTNFNNNILFNEAKTNLIKIINNTLSKNSKNLKNIYSTLKECEKVETYRIYGELINSNLHIKNDNNSEYLNVLNYYDNNNEIRIPLDKTISLSKNAQKYFKKYGKLKKAYSYNISQKETLENENKYLESVIYSIETTNNITELDLIKKELIMGKYIYDKKKKNIENNKKSKKQNIEKNNSQNTISPIKYVYNNYEIYVGKNNIQNNYLTHKFAKSNDIWLHAQTFHGSHVIIRNINNTNIPDEIIEFAASLASFYSKAYNSNKVNVDYCNIKYVKKHPSNMMGMVIYTNYKSVTVNPNKNEEYIVNSTN